MYQIFNLVHPLLIKGILVGETLWGLADDYLECPATYGDEVYGLLYGYAGVACGRVDSLSVNCVDNNLVGVGTGDDDITVFNGYTELVGFVEDDA